MLRIYPYSIGVRFYDGTKMKYISYLNMGKKEKLITHWRSVFLIWYGVQQIVDALENNKIFSVL